MVLISELHFNLFLILGKAICLAISKIESIGKKIAIAFSKDGFL